MEITLDKQLGFRNVAVTIFIVLTISYVLCALRDVLFSWSMYQVWGPLLPGFTWPLTVTGSLIGLLWLVG